MYNLKKRYLKMMIKGNLFSIYKSFEFQLQSEPKGLF